MSKNLVELMVKCCCLGRTKEDACAEMLKVVKEHIGEVAEVCPECKGSGNLHKPNPGQLAYYPCLKCKGSGVIWREQDAK